MLHQHRPVEAELAGLAEADPRDGKDRNQHREAADHGVDQELERGVDPAAFAPHPDQEIQRDQHRLPEHIEKDEVEGKENSGGRRLEKQK